MNILQPLGMKNTAYDHSETILPKQAAGYERTGRILNAPFLEMSVPFSAGALYSTVEDLFLWDQALYSAGLLADSLKKLYFTPVRNHYAFGWSVQKVAEWTWSVPLPGFSTGSRSPAPGGRSRRFSGTPRQPGDLSACL